jgi:pimeloyl-ACP methyl ester carboxylesterase
MPDVELNGTAYTYSDAGSGEPIVHICGDETDYEVNYQQQAGGASREHCHIPKLAKSKAITGAYRVISYERDLAPGRRKGGPAWWTTHPESREDVVKASDDCLALMRSLQIDKAHIFAHTLVTSVALDIALRAPDKVMTITMHEPEMFHPGWASRKMEGWLQKMAQSPAIQDRIEQWKSANPQWSSGTADQAGPRVGFSSAAVPVSSVSDSGFQRPVSTPVAGAEENQQDMGGGRGEEDDSVIQQVRALTGLADASTTGRDPLTFQMDLYLRSLVLVSGQDIAGRIRQPVLSMLTFRTGRDVKKSAELLKSILPQTQSYLVQRPHKFWRYVEEVDDVAPGLLDFLERSSFAMR